MRSSPRLKVGRLVVPREHGAWPMWIVPGITGAWLSQGDLRLAALFLVAVFLLFWARYPMWLWARSRSRRPGSDTVLSTVVVGLTGLALASGLVVASQRWAVFGLGALVLVVTVAHLALTARGRHRTLVAEFLGVFGLGLAGPATYLIAGGRLDTGAALAWLLPSLFFGSSVFAVKMRVEGYARAKRGAPVDPLVLRTVGYLAMMLAAVGLMSLAGLVGRFAVIAYLPVCVQALWPVRGLSASPSLGRLGAAWVAQSALFTVLLATLV